MEVTKGQMRIQLVLSCLLPGFAPLWYRGRWSGLMVALGFTFALNTVLLVTFVWPWLVHTALLLGAWLLLGCVWSFSIWRSIQRLRDSRCLVDRLEQDSDEAYREAQLHYLQGNWHEAEELLQATLKTAPEDIESRLMLATMYRHTDQSDQAAKQLRLLTRLEGAEQWELEIRRERELLKASVDLPSSPEEESLKEREEAA